MSTIPISNHCGYRWTKYLPKNSHSICLHSPSSVLNFFPKSIRLF